MGLDVISQIIPAKVALIAYIVVAYIAAAELVIIISLRATIRKYRRDYSNSEYSLFISIIVRTGGIANHKQTEPIAKLNISKT